MSPLKPFIGMRIMISRRFSRFQRSRECFSVKTIKGFWRVSNDDGLVSSFDGYFILGFCDTQRFTQLFNHVIVINKGLTFVIFI